MESTMPTISDLAGEAYDAFESFTREGADTTLYRLKDGSPEWVADLVREAHGEFFPDDWRYAAIVDACAYIHDNDADEDSAEFADQHTDVYNDARVAWLASSLYRAGYCDEAVDEGLVADDAGIHERIGVGQYMELSEVYGLVYFALEERAAALEELEDAQA